MNSFFQKNSSDYCFMFAQLFTYFLFEHIRMHTLADDDVARGYVLQHLGLAREGGGGKEKTKKRGRE